MPRFKKFFVKAREVVSGETSAQRMQRLKYEQETRKRERMAELEENRKQRIRLSREAQRIKADRKLKSLKQPQGPSISQSIGIIGSGFGAAPEPKKVYKRKPMKKKKKKGATYYVRNVPETPKRFNILTGSYE